MEQAITEPKKEFIPRQSLPNAAATLVLGILSIVFAFCCWSGGIIGITLGIIALVISSKPLKMYKENPEMWDGYGNLKAGRITAIIGLCLSSVWAVFLVIYLSIVGSIAAFSISEILNHLH
jgi:hypothetical protein